ncbi:MAG: HPt (histidine-containing phosphotransfer) domain-containing protein [Sphingobacteriales bacterium]|jgi:HPt (histidine-containing phosphotransfer) domain-containing protein
MIDLTYLNSISTNKEFISKTINMFLEDTPSNVEKINLATKNEEWIEVYNIVHKLVPNIEMIGFIDLSTLCREIE